MNDVSREMAKIACHALSDKKAEDVQVIDISEISVIADYFVIKKSTEDKGFNAVNIVIWVIGFALYRYLMTVDIIVGNTLPDMVITLILCVFANKIVSKNK